MRATRLLKDYFRDGAIHRWKRSWDDHAALAEWEKSGRPIPPPPAFKQQLIRATAARFGARVLVETGTYYGGTIASVLNVFETIYSIELSEELHARAVGRFKRHQKVRLCHGDSASELPGILNELNGPALFWLDAHYSGEGTARADVDTPIVQEMKTIAGHRVRQHVVLIDDARLFNGTDGYPTIEGCRAAATQFWPDHKFNVADDVISITP
jgi:hypothetical protein